MAWTFPDGEIYEGAVHTIGRWTYSGKTRTVLSRRLIRVADAVVPLQEKKAGSGKKVRKRRTRAEIAADKAEEALAASLMADE